jgi:Outer spore coat protein E (CotE).
MANNIREIMTKAVVAKGNVKNEKTYSIKTEKEASSVLGCWIINHDFKSFIEQDHLFVEGTYDINLWYAPKDGTNSEVYIHTINYKDELVLTKEDDIILDKTFITRAHSVISPTCKTADVIATNKIEILIEKEFNCDVIGDTFIFVEVLNSKEVLNQLDFKINENFIEE